MCSLRVYVCMLSCFSHVRLFATLWTVARQAPLSMVILNTRILEWADISFSRDLSNPGTELPSLISSALAGEFFTISTT